MLKSKWIVTPLIALAVACAAADPQANDAQANKEAINKKAVLGFYDAVSRFDFDAARPFIGPYYIQHSPQIEDGTEGLRKALNKYRDEFKGGSLPKLDVKMVIADGDYVAMLSHVTGLPGNPGGFAVGDLFRLLNGKLVEHWDITERLVSKSPDTGMFDSPEKH